MPAVRLGPAEMLAMRQRTVTHLTDEGAKNWYAIDVNALLDEIQILQSEIQAIRDSLVIDGADAHRPIVDMLEDWKLNCSGVYEKRVTKRLQHETREALKAQKTLTNDLNGAISRHMELAHELADAKDQLNEAISARYDDAERHKAQMAAQDETEIELREELLEARRNLQESERRAQQAVAVVSALERERREAAQELLREISVLIGG